MDIGNTDDRVDARTSREEGKWLEAKYMFRCLSIAGLPYVRPMSTVSAVAGKQFHIKCPVAGYPIESIVWEKGEYYIYKREKRKNTLSLDTRVEFIFEIFPDSFDHGGGKLSGHVVSRWCKVAHKHETEGCERQPVHRYGATSRRSGHVHVHREEQA